jgi:hypothetical protein
MAAPGPPHYHQDSQKAQESQILNGYVLFNRHAPLKDSPRRTQVTEPKLRLSLP